MSFRLAQPRQALKLGGQASQDDAGVKIDAWLAESACAAQKGRSPLLRDLGQDGVDAEPLSPPLARHRQGPRISRTCPSKAPAWGSSFASPPPSKGSPTRPKSLLVCVAVPPPPTRSTLSSTPQLASTEALASPNTSFWASTPSSTTTQRRSFPLGPPSFPLYSLSPPNFISDQRSTCLLVLKRSSRP